MPIHNFLKEKGYAYPTVTITLEKVTLATDEISIPIPCCSTKHGDTDTKNCSVEPSYACLNDLDRTYKGALARATSQHVPAVVCGLHGELSPEKR